MSTTKTRAKRARTNLTANLFSSKVRKETLDGRKYFVAPLTMIVPGVLNGSKGALYYPPEEIRKNHDAWNYIPIVVEHPTHNGVPVSGRTPRVIQNSGIGHVFNTRITASGKLAAEGWFDAEKTKQVSPQVYQALLNGQPIELSTGLFTKNERYKGEFNGKPYDFIAREYRPDHLAILPGEEGACSLKDGCGVGMTENSGPTCNCEGDKMCGECAAKADKGKRKRGKKKPAMFANTSTSLSKTSGKRRKKKNATHNQLVLNRTVPGSLAQLAMNNCGIGENGFEKGNQCAKGGTGSGSSQTKTEARVGERRADSNRAHEASQIAREATQRTLHNGNRENHRAALEAQLRAARHHKAAAANTIGGLRAQHKFLSKEHFTAARSHELALGKSRGRDVPVGARIKSGFGRTVKKVAKGAVGASIGLASGYGSGLLGSYIGGKVAEKVSGSLGSSLGQGGAAFGSILGQKVGGQLAAQATAPLIKPITRTFGGSARYGHSIGGLASAFISPGDLKGAYDKYVGNKANCGIGPGGFQEGNTCAKGSAGTAFEAISKYSTEKGYGNLKTALKASRQAGEDIDSVLAAGVKEWNTQLDKHGEKWADSKSGKALFGSISSLASDRASVGTAETELYKKTITGRLKRVAGPALLAGTVGLGLYGVHTRNQASPLVNQPNCGIGPDGFQNGNTCAKGSRGIGSRVGGALGAKALSTGGAIVGGTLGAGAALGLASIGRGGLSLPAFYGGVGLGSAAGGALYGLATRKRKQDRTGRKESRKKALLKGAAAGAFGPQGAALYGLAHD